VTTTVLDKFITILGFEADDSGIRKARKSFNEFAKDAKKIGKDLTTRVTFPIVGLGATMIKLASDAEETQNRFNEVFKGIEDEADTASKEISKSFNLAGLTTQKLLADTGDLLTGLGFTKKESLELAKSVVSLSGDITSFKDVQGGAERAALSITKALLGEAESLKDTAKIALLEADVQDRLKIIRKQNTGLTEQQAKALARLSIIQERTTTALGDYEKTKESAANQSRSLTEELKSVGVELGTILLPMFLKGVKKVRELVKAFSELTTEQKENILQIAGIAAVVGPLIFALGVLASSISSIIGLGVILFGVFRKLAIGTILWKGFLLALSIAANIVGFAFTLLMGVLKALRLLLFANPIGIAILAVVAMGAAVLKLTGQWDNFVNLFKKGFDFVMRGLGRAKDFIGGIFGGSNNVNLNQSIEGAAARNTAPVASPLRNSIVPRTNNSQNNNVRIDNIHIDAQGADSAEIATNIANVTRDTFQNTVQDFDSTIAR